MLITPTQQQIEGQLPISALQIGQERKGNLVSLESLIYANEAVNGTNSIYIC